MAWLILIVAGLLEVGWALGLPYTAGFTRLWPTVATGAAMIGSMWLLAIATRTIPIGTAYPVWVGVGIAGSVVGGMILFREPMSLLRALFLLLLIAAIVGLKLTTRAS